MSLKYITKNSKGQPEIIDNKTEDQELYNCFKLKDKNLNIDPKQQYCLKVQGMTYEGTLNDKFPYQPLGQGKLIGKNNQTIYEGGFTGNLIKEKSFTTIVEDGQIKYQGFCKDKKYHGKGIEYYPNGNKLYKGEYENGRFNGKGKYYNKQGEIKYKGKYKDNAFHGKGRLNLSEDLYYEGEFKNHEFFDGKIYDKDNEVLFEFKNGKVQGNNEVLYHKNNNNIKYVGTVLPSGENAHGYGIKFFNLNNFSIEHIGNFENGHKYGIGAAYNRDGQMIKKGQFNKGVLVLEITQSEKNDSNSYLSKRNLNEVMINDENQLHHLDQETHIEQIKQNLESKNFTEKLKRSQTDNIKNPVKNRNIDENNEYKIINRDNTHEIISISSDDNIKREANSDSRSESSTYPKNNNQNSQNMLYLIKAGFNRDMLNKT